MKIPRKTWAFILAAAVPLSVLAEPMAGEHIGVGILLGYPAAGISAKLPMDPTHSLNGMLGYSLQPEHGNLYTRWDYVWHNYDLIPGLIQVPKGRLPLYYGPGIHASISGDHAALGVQGVVGVEYQFPNDPLDAFFEIAPGINLLPGTDPAIAAGVGVRFFF